MSIDPNRYMRLAEIRDDLLDNPIDAPGLSTEDRALIQDYERNVIRASWKALTGEDLGVADTLCVQLRSDADQIDSYTSGQLQQAISTAAAGIAKWQRKPGRTASPVNRDDRAMARLLQPSVSHNLLVFKVPAEQSILPGYDVPTAASPALRELIETLPASDDSNIALDGIFGSHPLVRQAVQTLSKATRQIPGGIDLDLFVPGEAGSRKSVLTSSVAKEIDESLDTPSATETTRTLYGYLDGFRATRRVFYLIENRGQSNEREIPGAVSGELLETVRELAGKDVVARVIETKWQTRSARRGRSTYELASLELQRSLFDEEQQP